MPLDSAERHQTVQIAAPKLRVAKFKLIGSAPYVQLRISEKAIMRWPKR